MNKIEKFEDVLAWQKSQDLCVNIYQAFQKSRDFGFRDQIYRASVSISNNIAEGFERSGDNQFKMFLSIAKGSCGEVRSMLYLASRLEYIDKDNFKVLYDQAQEISKMLAGFIRYLKS